MQTQLVIFVHRLAVGLPKL